MSVLPRMPVTKPEQIRVTVGAEDADFIRTLSTDTGFSMADLAGMFLRSAIKAARECKGEISMPLRLQVQGSKLYALNETAAVPVSYQPPRARR
jgi:hypothetical protein